MQTHLFGETDIRELVVTPQNSFTVMNSTVLKSYKSIKLEVALSLYSLHVSHVIVYLYTLHISSVRLSTQKHTWIEWFEIHYYDWSRMVLNPTLFQYNTPIEKFIGWVGRCPSCTGLFCHVALAMHLSTWACPNNLPHVLHVPGYYSLCPCPLYFPPSFKTFSLKVLKACKVTRKK